MAGRRSGGAVNSALYVAMSTLTGQSDRHPLHDRHRSSASRTSVERHPSVTRSPCSISHSRCARPARRVHLVVRRLVARAHHPAAGLPALADPDAASLGLGEVAVVVGIAEQRQQLSVLGRPEVPDRLVERGRLDDHAAGSSARAGSQMCFISASSARPSDPYMRPSSSERARPSPCSPETEPPRATTRSVASSTNDRYAATPFGAEQIEVDPHVHAALTEVPVRGAGQAVSAHQLVEAAQVVGEAFRRYGRVLPAAPRLGTVGPRVASPAASVRHRHSTACAPGSVTRDAVAGEPESRSAASIFSAASSAADAVLAAHLDEQPGAACGKTGFGRRPTHVARQPVDQVDVDGLHRQRAVRKHDGHAFGGCDGVGEARAHTAPAHSAAGVSATVARSVAAKPPSLPHNKPATS